MDVERDHRGWIQYLNDHSGLLNVFVVLLIWHSTAPTPPPSVIVQAPACQPDPIVNPCIELATDLQQTTWVDTSESAGVWQNEILQDEESVEPTPAVPQQVSTGNCNNALHAIQTLICCVFPCDCLPDK